MIYGKGMHMRIGVIGGGAAGMTAAIFAAKCGGDVTILEHTGRVGKKILSTGNGKCNFTNQKLSKDDYNGNHPSFADSVIAYFNQQAAVDFFESCGMLTVSKRDGYYYPRTGQASTVLNVLRYQLESLGVKIVSETYINKVNKTKNATFLVNTKEQQYVFDKIILACGGNAAPATGSDGSGYALARSFGHSIVKPLPVLTYLKSRSESLKELAGVRVNAGLTLVVDNKTVQKEDGELQLNKDNISGIPVFQLSHKAIRALDEKRKVSVSADFLPDIDEAVTSEKIHTLMQMYAKLPVSEALSGMLHKKVCGAVLHRTGISFDKKMERLSLEDIHALVSCIKGFVFSSSFIGSVSGSFTLSG